MGRKYYPRCHPNCKLFNLPLSQCFKGHKPSTHRRLLQKWKDLYFHWFTPTISSLKKLINRSFYHSICFYIVYSFLIIYLFILFYNIKYNQKITNMSDILFSFMHFRLFKFFLISSPYYGIIFSNNA